MKIQTIQQLNTYVDALPWYKRIFFPQVIWTRLQQLSVTEAEIRAHYASEIKASWLALFYGWLFPELLLFAQMPSGDMPQPMHAAPLEETGLSLPANYEEDLRESITHKNNSEFNRLAHYLSTHTIEEDALIRILRASIKYENYSATLTLSRITAYNTQVVSKAFVAAVKNTHDEWWGTDAISEFTGDFSPLRSLINSVSMHEVMLLLASMYQTLAASQIEHERLNFFHIESNLQRLLHDKEMRNKISLATVTEFLQQILIPLRYESEGSVALIREAVHFEDAEGCKLPEETIQLAYLQAIRMGRVEALSVFDERVLQPSDERVVQALKDAAKNAHYAMVLHLIKTIPSDRRFEILQTKTIVHNNKPYKDKKEPEFTHILQWAACRSVPKDTHTILDTLDNAQERCALISNTPDSDNYSPLLLAAVNCRQDNLSIMLNALSTEQAMEAILPKKVTFFTPLDPFYSFPKEDHEIKVMPVLLGKVFGENQKLYNAYQHLKSRMNNWDTLRHLRDYYLATHFPTTTQKAIHFFTGGYTIPGHPLNKEELDKVVRVVLYQNYHVFDSAQRSRIELRMSAKEQPLGKNVAAI